MRTRTRKEREERREKSDKKRKKKKEKGDGKERWTTKGRAWLERRDDGAGKGEEEKRHTHTDVRRDGRESETEKREMREGKRKRRGSADLMSSPAPGRK